MDEIGERPGRSRPMGVALIERALRRKTGTIPTYNPNHLADIYSRQNVIRQKSPPRFIGSGDVYGYTPLDYSRPEEEILRRYSQEYRTELLVLKSNYGVTLKEATDISIYNEKIANWIRLARLGIDADEPIKPQCLIDFEARRPPYTSFQNRY